MISSPITTTMRTLVSLLLLGLLAGCATHDAPQRIALFAPFEGRYRELGYAALYPARLALSDAGQAQVELLPVDDGGTIATAMQRAQAIQQDPQIQAVIVQGYMATHPDVLAILADLPVIIVGDWGTPPTSPQHVILAHTDLPQDNRRTPFEGMLTQSTGGEIIGMDAFRKATTAALTLTTSGQLPTAAFTERITASDPFATAPNHLGMLTYDALMIALHENPLDTVQYDGLSGEFQFVDGYWQQAPINTLRLVDGALIAANE